MCRHCPFKVAMACVYLSAKVGEDQRAFTDLLNVFHHICQTRRRRAGELVSVEALPVHGPRYTRWAEAITVKERWLLKETGFLLYALLDSHPHKYVLHMVHALSSDDALDGGQKQGRMKVGAGNARVSAVSLRLAQRAWACLNDLQRTDLCVRVPANEIAAGAVEFSAVEQGVALPNAWEQVFGITERGGVDATVAATRQLYKEVQAFAAAEAGESSSSSSSLPGFHWLSPWPGKLRELSCGDTDGGHLIDSNDEAAQ